MTDHPRRTTRNPRRRSHRSALGSLALAALALAFGRSAVASAQESGPGPRVRHRHPHASRLPLDDSLRAIRIVPAVLPPVAGDRAAADGRGRSAFTVDRTRLFVVDRRRAFVGEVVGVPFEWRPISDVTWAGGRLVFDRWSSPHVGMHYVLDATTRRIVAAWSFHDDVAER